MNIRTPDKSFRIAKQAVAEAKAKFGPPTNKNYMESTAWLGERVRQLHEEKTDATVHHAAHY